MNTEQWDMALNRLIETAITLTRLDGAALASIPELYHFTDEPGAIGIIKSASLWASRAQCLNDSSEIEFGLRVTRTVLQRRIEAGSGSVERRFRETALKYLEPQAAPPILPFDVDHFVISFCERADKSNHWLHYGRGGAGYALGFEPDGLKRSGFDLAKVLYKLSEQEKVVLHAAEVLEAEMLRICEQVENTGARWTIEIAGHLFATLMSGLASRFKHPAFEDENEWRLIVLDIPEVEGRDRPSLERGFRSVNGLVVPYLVVPFGKVGGLPLRSVLLGARVDLQSNRTALQRLLRESGVPASVRIEQSTVPVR